jgi:acylphosphatase
MTRFAARLQLEGRVQGVGFRWWTVETARRLGVCGWVRNRRDGSVEVLVIGEAEALERLVEACRLGPPGARASGLRKAPAEDDGSRGFEPRPTL